MTLEEEVELARLKQLQAGLVSLRNECLMPERFDASGAMVLSYAIRWIWFKIEGKPYVPED